MQLLRFFIFVITITHLKDIHSKLNIPSKLELFQQEANLKIWTV